MSLSLLTVNESTGDALIWRLHHSFCPIITCTVVDWFARFRIFFVGCEIGGKLEKWKHKLALSVLALLIGQMGEGDSPDEGSGVFEAGQQHADQLGQVGYEPHDTPLSNSPQG